MYESVNAYVARILWDFGWMEAAKAFAYFLCEQWQCSLSQMTLKFMIKFSKLSSVFFIFIALLFYL